MNDSCKVLVGPLVVMVGMVFCQKLSAQTFSLDDNPVAPLTTPLPAGAIPAFGFGAEDPFGILVPPPGSAPSPSLASPGAGPLLDGTILHTGAAFPDEPETHLPPPFDAGSGLPHNYLDALSNNSLPTTVGATVNLLFSIDRTSGGVAGSHSFIEAGFNQQPGDIYVSSSKFASPGTLPPALPPGAGFVPGRLTPPSPGSNRLLFNQDRFDLTAGLPAGPGSGIPPFTPAPPIGPGTHDNLDAFDLRALDTTGDMVADVNYFFSINPVDAIDKQFATFGAPFDSADVWIAPVGLGGASMVYAPAAALGLAPMPILPAPPVMGNDVDGLVVWDVGSDGIATPGADFALFSLSPGSVDLAVFANSPADVFFTDFSGSYAIYASAADLGLLPTDNVDALEFLLSGDANLSGSVNLADLNVLAFNYRLSVTLDPWTKGDFDGNGEVGLSDLVKFAGAFGSTTNTAVGAGLPAAYEAPEPGALALVALAVMGVVVGRRQRSRRICTSAAARCRVGMLVLLASVAAESHAATVSVTTSDLGGGLFQHVLNVEATDGDVLGFELLLEDPLGRINQIDPFGVDTVFADDAVTLFPLIGADPNEDTHLLYNRTVNFSIATVDTGVAFSVATGVSPTTPLVVFGASRDLFQLVTVGDISLTAARLRVNVGGGDQLFDGAELRAPTLPGDFDEDFDVDGDDLNDWRTGFGAVGTAGHMDGDADGDLDVDGADFLTWQRQLGSPPPAVAANVSIPEPPTSMLVVVAAVGIRRIGGRMRQELVCA